VGADFALEALKRRFVAVHSADYLPVFSDDDADLIQGLLPSSGVAILYGPTQTAKSVFCLDMCISIASGMRYRGKSVRQGTVAYVVAEGSKRFPWRYQANLIELGLNRPDLPIFFIHQTPNLLSGDFAELYDCLGGIEPNLIVIDTMSKCMPGADENASGPMTQMLVNLQFLAEEFGALVLVIAHTGKNSENGIRGHSSLLAGVDVAIETKSLKPIEQKKFEARVVKNRDGEAGEVFGFQVKKVVIHEKQDGSQCDAPVCIHLNSEGMADEGAVAGARQWELVNLVVNEAPMTRDGLLRAITERCTDEKVRPRARDIYRASLKTLLDRGKLAERDGYVCLGT
jgi:AAA domain